MRILSTLLGERHHVLLSIVLVLNEMVLVLAGVNRIEQKHEKTNVVIENGSR